MLQSINGRAKQWIILPLFGLLILSFVAWGIADVFQGNTGKDTVITVGKVEYSGQQLQAEVQRGMEYLRQMMGNAITLQQALQYGFVDKTINTMIQRALLQQEAKRLGIVVSDNVIMQAIRDLPEFKQADGSFNAEAFKSALMRIGANEAMFVAEQRQTLARAQVQQVVSDGAMAPDLLNRAIMAASAEGRDFEVFVVKADRLKIADNADDAALSEYMAANPDKFSLPEYRGISLIRLSASDVAEGITVPDDDVRAYYDSHQAEFETPEKRDYQQVVASTQEEAVKVIAAYNVTRDFEAAATSAGTSATPLKGVSKNELPQELREEGFALTNGAVSKAIQSDLGWHVLLQTAVTPASTRTFEQAKTDIHTNLVQQAAQDQLYQASAQLDDLIAGGTSLEDMATQLKVQVRKAEATDKEGNNPAGTALGPILGQPEMLKEAFRLEQGAQSDVIATPAGDYFVVRIDSVTPARLKELSAVRADVLKAWTAEKQMDAATEQGLKVLAEAKKGTPMAEIANSFGIEASLEKNVTRVEDQWPKILPVAFAKDLFDLKMNDATQFPGDGGVIVARLVGVHHPVDVEKAEVQGAFAQKSNEITQGEMFEAYSNALRKRYPVTIDQAGIDRIFKQEDVQ